MKIEDPRRRLRIEVDFNNYLPVNTKIDFVRRYQTGEFGNSSPTWDSVKDWAETCAPPGLFHLRNRVVSGKTVYNVPHERVLASWFDLVKSGVKESDIYISAMAPTEKTLYQGEVHQTEKGLSLYGTCVKKPVREALKESSESSTGLVAVTTLRHYMCPNSYEWLEILLDRYPGHVIEFSSYSKNWGTLPNFNTVFWEIRLYNLLFLCVVPWLFGLIS